MKYIILMIVFFVHINANEISYTKVKNSVIDEKNRLMWQDNSEVKKYLETFVTAKIYCENTVLNGYIDWRVPSIQELQQIVDLSNSNAIDKKFKYIQAGLYQSKSLFVKDTRYVWIVDFNTGKSTLSLAKDEKYIRCVRDIL